MMVVAMVPRPKKGKNGRTISYCRVQMLAGGLREGGNDDAWGKKHKAVT